MLSRATPDDAVRSGWTLGLRGADSWREIALPLGVVTLGGRGSDVQLPGCGGAVDQARLELDDAGAHLRVTAAAAVALLNGVSVREATLHTGDLVRLGGVDLILNRRWAAAAAEAAPRPAAASEGPVAQDRTSAGLLETLNKLLHWSLRGGADRRAEMLACLGLALGAEAGCLLDVPPSPGSLRCTASWGDPRLDTITDERLRSCCSGPLVGDRVQLSAVDGLSMGSLRTPTGATFCLLLGGVPPTEEAIAAQRVATRLFAYEQLREQASAGAIRAPLPPRGLVFPAEIIVGRAPAMTRLYEQVAGIVGAPLPVLLLGETGVGKEHVARLIHDSSSRASKPFVSINCAAIPGDLLESELFGIGRGVATGVEERAGKFQEANGGTLFLDEIGELPLPLQAKLLRALEEKRVHAVGGRAAAVDLRIVAATNAELEAVATAGRFRLDLYHRLAGFVIEVPPLRARPQDIAVLFGRFLALATRGSQPALSPPAVTALVRYSWPGNVRELRHEAARVAARAAPGELVETEHLSPGIAAAAGDVQSHPGQPGRGRLNDELDRVERGLIVATLASLGGNQSRTAVQLGISRERLRRRLRELGLGSAAANQA